MLIVEPEEKTFVLVQLRKKALKLKGAKLLEHLTNLFCNMKLLLQHREENIKVFLVGKHTIINF